MTALLFITNQALADRICIVCKGDTLYSIAQRYQTTVSAIEKANGIDSRKPIHADQKLVIPSDIPARGTCAHITKDDVKLTANEKDVIATLSKGTEVRFVEQKDGGYAVKLADGRMGLVPADCIEFDTVTQAEIKTEGKTEIKAETERQSPASAVDRHAFGREIARVAYTYRGSRYRRGGSSASGFDCSGFVKHVYEAKGIKLPRTSYDMYNCGRPVAKEDLREGDLVFFANTYRRGISHVGMYVGDGEFIHASTTRGGVRIDKLDDAYFRGKYAGARRIKEDES